MEGQETLSSEQVADDAQFHDGGSPFMNEEQIVLRDKAVTAMSAAFSKVLPEMTILAALESLTNFFCSSVVHVFFVFGKLEVLEARVIGKEIERRIKYLKALKKNGSAKQQKARKN